MKKFITIINIIIIITFISISSVSAQSATSSAKKRTLPTTEELSPTPKSKIDQIKEKVANTVASLNLVSKKAMSGQILKLEKDQLTIDTHTGNQLVDVDELTQYSKIVNGKKTDSKFTDLHIGDTILVMGIYNKDSKKLSAKFIYRKDIAYHVNGTIKEVDIKGNTITVEQKKTQSSTSSEIHSFTIEVDKTTKISSYSETQGITKSDITKTEIGQKIIVFGSPDTTASESARVLANRILLLPSTISAVPNPSDQLTPTTQPLSLTPASKLKSFPTKKPTTSIPTPTQIP